MKVTKCTICNKILTNKEVCVVCRGDIILKNGGKVVRKNTALIKDNNRNRR